MSFDKDKITKVIAFFGTFGPHSVTFEKIETFQFKNHYTDKKLSIKKLMEDIKPEVMKKHEIEYRDQSKLISILDLFGLSGFRFKNQGLSVFYSKVLLKYRAVD